MTRTINKLGLELVKEMEGFRQDAYLCPAGVWTIGYGHTGDVHLGQKISKAEAENLLKADLQKSCIRVMQLITVPLSDNQFAALVSFTFNCGDGSLSSSTLRRRLNLGEYACVPTELAKWVKATDPQTKSKVTLPGLVRRRAAEARLWLTPDGAEAPHDEGMAHAVEVDEAPNAGGRIRYEVIARSGLKLRGGPGLAFPTLRSLPCNTTIYGAREQDGWVEVDLEGDGYCDGWVYASFLRTA